MNELRIIAISLAGILALHMIEYTARFEDTAEDCADYEDVCECNEESEDGC